MKTTTIIALTTLVCLTLNAAAQEPTSAPAGSHEKTILNGSVGIGTFSAGENLGGSAFVGASLSADCKPNKKTGFSYGLESGLLSGETQGHTIYGIPAIIRLGWHPGFVKNKTIDLFVLVKGGWAFGIWNSQLEEESSPNGIVGGINLVGRYYLTPLVDVYAELGYTYYGLARSSNHPEYPLGYGSGKLYASLGLSLKLGKR